METRKVAAQGAAAETGRSGNVRERGFKIVWRRGGGGGGIDYRDSSG